MSASIRVTSRADDVAGVKLPVFVQYDAECLSRTTGSRGCGRKASQCRDNFGEYL